MSDYSSYYSESIKGHGSKIHLSSHSHYFWPDSALDGYKEYWKLATNQSDQKWERIFSVDIPNAQKRISSVLNFPHPERITFAPNTQELAARVISSFYYGSNLSFLTTKSEFHSFSRQISRLEEEKNVTVNYVDNEQEDFEQSFLNSITSDLTMIFVSQVFYNSGLVITKDFIKKIIDKKSKDTILMIDGYHGFYAVPTDLSDIIDDVYYLSGCYKYAQAGEGLCFMTSPKDCNLRPLNTGWFAAFSDLESKKDEVEYDSSGLRFASSTLDFSTLFKFNSIWKNFDENEISYIDIINHSKNLQKIFIESSNKKYLISNDIESIGLFVTYAFESIDDCQLIHSKLIESEILTDRRSNRLRFSFGAYINKDQCLKASNTFNKLLEEFID